MKLLFALLLCFVASLASAQTKCVQNARELAPQLSDETRRDFERKLAEARADFERSPTPENYIWLGRRTAYLGRYKEAVGIYGDGIKKFPADARLFRHLGHRLITLRCFDDAIANLQTAVFWSNGTSDQIEPDGLPNARNIPTSTLQSNIWYHLGLARYLKGDFRGALTAYREAEKVSKNPDMLVATRHWLYMTLRRLGRTAQAKKSIAAIPDNLDVIENGDYYRLIKLYQGKLKPADLLDSNQSATALSNATVGYGVANWFLYTGSPTEAEKIFRKIVSGDQWASFGYIAAEAELTQRRGWQISSPPKQSFSVLVPVPLTPVAWIDGEHAATLQADQSASWAQCYSAIETTPQAARFGVIVVDKQSDRSFYSSNKRESYLEYFAWVLIGDEDETQYMRPPGMITQHGLTGRDYLYVKQSPHQGNLYTRGRLFETPRHVFVAVFIGETEQDLTSPDAERFLGSFRLKRPLRN